MAETPAHSQQDGCGFVGAILRRGPTRPNSSRTSSSSSGQSKNTGRIKLLLTSANSKRQRNGSSGEGELAISNSSSMLPKKADLPKPSGKPPKKPSLNTSATTALHRIRPNENKDSSKSSMSFFNNASMVGSSMISGSQVVNSEYTKKLRREPTFTSGELSVSTVKRINKESDSGRLYKASANSVMLLRELGNLNQNAHSKPVKVPAIGNILRKQRNERNVSNSFREGKNGMMMNQMDSDSLKSLGNERFKEGKFEEALDLYNQAIAVDPNKASFYSNKSAALMSLGRLTEAVFECSAAISLEPYYHNAHYRMARLYIRLGEAEKAIDHYEQSGRKASSKDIAEAEKLRIHIRKCSGARREKNWEALLNDSREAINIGADSAPQVYAMQAEALMELRRHEEAYKVIDEGPNVSVELCTKLFGASETAKLMMVRAKVYLTAGRFEDAVNIVTQAAKMATSDEVHSLAKRINSVASSRKAGNKLFSSSRYVDACLVYTSALDEVPHNSILLCNRAACRSKLGQHEKAVEDCTAALYVRPSYSKARLRRADSNAKLERWEAALKDYEILIQEVPGEEEVRKGYSEAIQRVKRQQKYENQEPPRRSLSLKDALVNEKPVEFVTAADFYCNSDSFKTLKVSIDGNSRANRVTPEFNRPVTTLQEIFTR
ncbi:OLC1v1017440C1 [Oldenlandia corymbosa var. corymbosa]|uniref:OLC1v1017440C1 n=1 Tax=Oldenlandia corymbosa var. corymbosa TaxID=529605 RepID=A0AAV1E9D5_OLDCO|nr:OLC1v1017440C1 [Oldenlandia corymbosa var. corymbosa]